MPHLQTMPYLQPYVPPTVLTNANQLPGPLAYQAYHGNDQFLGMESLHWNPWQNNGLHAPALGLEDHFNVPWHGPGIFNQRENGGSEHEGDQEKETDLAHHGASKSPRRPRTQNEDSQERQSSMEQDSITGGDPESSSENSEGDETPTNAQNEVPDHREDKHQHPMIRNMANPLMDWEVRVEWRELFRAINTARFERHLGPGSGRPRRPDR